MAKSFYVYYVSFKDEDKRTWLTERGFKKGDSLENVHCTIRNPHKKKGDKNTTRTVRVIYKITEDLRRMILALSDWERYFDVFERKNDRGTPRSVIKKAIGGMSRSNGSWHKPL